MPCVTLYRAFAATPPVSAGCRRCYRFITTPTCPYMTARPRFEYAETFFVKVTEEFCDYLREDRLDIKVRHS